MKTTKSLIALLFLAGIFFSCQKQQVFNQSSEIDLVKKSMDAAAKQDWATYRSLLHDTAQIYINDWFHNPTAPDQFIENLKSHFKNVSELKIAPNTIYEMVVTPEGKHWVHLWTEITYSLKDGNEVPTVEHIVAQVESNKIVFLGAILNSLPRYLAENAIKKGSLIGIHNATIKLNPGVTLEQYQQAFVEKMIPAYEKNAPGLKVYWVKGVRGEKENSVGTMWIFPSEQLRSQYFNPDGSSTELGKELQEKIKPAADEMSKLGTYTYKYTDWLVQ